MKALLKSFAILSLLAFFFAPEIVRAQDDSQDGPGVSFQTFYDQLGADGTWIQTDDYGYVFQPNVNDPNWAPYTDGHWVYTDDGWTWASDEPWGWATYHYGRWANIDDVGWVWVPGYRWGPAWVSWRYGGGYAGWAPLPPESFQGEEYGDGYQDGSDYHYGNDVDISFNIGAGCYNFVPVEYIGESSYRGRFVDRDRNYGIINQTTNVTNINISGRSGAGRGFRGVSVGGPQLADVNSRARTHVRTVNLTAANQPGRSALQGNSLAVYAPRVNPATARQGQPTRVGQTINHPTFNRGDVVTKPLAVRANVRPAAPSAAVIQAAQTAQAHVPASAKIATAQTPVPTRPNRQLDSIAPSVQTPQGNPAAITPVAPNASIENPNSVNPNKKHRENGVNSPFTGEPVTPSVTPQPSANKPATALSPVVHPTAPNEGQPVAPRVNQEANDQQQSRQQQQNAAEQAQTARLQRQAEAQQQSRQQDQATARQQQQAEAQQQSRQQDQATARQQQQAEAQQQSRQQEQAAARQQQQAEAQQQSRQQEQAASRQQQQAEAQQQVRQQQQSRPQPEAQAPRPEAPHVQPAAAPQAAAPHPAPAAAPTAPAAAPGQRKDRGPNGQ